MTQHEMNPHARERLPNAETRTLGGLLHFKYPQSVGSMGDETGRGSSNGDDGGISAPPSAPEGAPLREEQIRNAVGFLSHPKVRGSSESSKRSFLEQKGLTASEIAEAFRRVPEATVPTSVPQDVPPLPTAALTTTVNHLQPAPYSGAPGGMQHMQQHPGPEPIRWSQVALGAGFCAAGAYAVKSLVWPFVHDKYSAWRSRDGDSAPASGSPTDNTAAVADAIRAQTAELATSIQAIQELVAKLDSQRSPSPDDRLTASELRQELRSFASTLNEIAAPAARSPAGPSSSVELELAEIKALLSDFLKTPRSGERTPTDAQDSRTTPASYRSASERPIISSNASPEQLPRPDSHQEQQQGQEQRVSREPASGAHPASYMEVLEMLERGETPPGIRTDINDKPPNPDQEPAPSRMERPLKPWEQNTRTENGASVDGDGSSISLTPQVYLPGGGGGEGEDTVSAARAPSGGGGGGTETETETDSVGASPHRELSANGRRKAASIYEAATTSTNASPSVIAGRLSPVPGKPRGRAQGALLFPDVLDSENGSVGIDTNNAPPSTGSVQSSMGMPDGSGLGRPASRGWMPPPLPMPILPTLSGQSPSMQQSASGKSLGEEFSSA